MQYLMSRMLAAGGVDPQDIVRRVTQEQAMRGSRCVLINCRWWYNQTLIHFKHKDFLSSKKCLWAWLSLSPSSYSCMKLWFSCTLRQELSI